MGRGPKNKYLWQSNMAIEDGLFDDSVYLLKMPMFNGILLELIPSGVVCFASGPRRSASADELQDLVDQNHGETEGHDQHPVVHCQGNHAKDGGHGWDVQNDEMAAWDAQKKPRPSILASEKKNKFKGFQGLSLASCPC